MPMTDEQLRSSTQVDRAYRAIACVNGCEGIPNPAAMTELLAAAKEAESLLVALCVHGATAVPWTGIARLRAAIAAAENKQ